MPTNLAAFIFFLMIMSPCVLAVRAGMQADKQ